MKRRFEYSSGAPGRELSVELYGDVSDWGTAVVLTPEGSGRFAGELDLPSGVYQYKFLTRSWTSMFGESAEWLLDPQNDRTRSEKGLQNSIAVIDGAPEPWLFALGPPWIEALGKHTVRVLTGVRRPLDGGDLLIAWSEDGGATWRQVRADEAFEEAEHAFFLACLPTAAAEIDLRLEHRASRFEARWRRPPKEPLPAWWKVASLYAIFVDRFRPEHDDPSWGVLSEPGAPAGGHLEGIRRSLDELADLGVDTLCLSPVHVAASAHRQDVVDPLCVDPRLGGESAYDALVRDARQRGMRIVQDLTLFHAGIGFPPYEDVKACGASSPYASWFVWNADALVHRRGQLDAPLLDLNNADVQALVLEAVAFWASRGVSGLRLDDAAAIPVELGSRIRSRFRELVPDGVVIGELVPRHAWRWHSASALDVATDYGFHEVVIDLATREDAFADDALKTLSRLELLRGGDVRTRSVRFLSSCDHVRLATLTSPARAMLAHVLLLTLPGVPLLLYGEEYGLSCGSVERALADVWLERIPMPWTEARRDPDVRSALQALLRARRESEALREGSLQLLFADPTMLRFRRQSDSEIVDVVLNLADAPKNVAIDDAEYPRLEALAAIGGAGVNGEAVDMAPLSAIVVRRERAPGRSIMPSRARRNLLLRDRDLIHASQKASARPSRFHFSITERCNLRCLHCNTAAPDKTRLGTARTMTPNVLEALAADFGFAEYFAFVHGGETLMAPIFSDVLRAIAAARGTEPYVAHLLTNGVNLDVATASSLAGLGLSSIAVSLDGATAASNDAIRLGGRFFDVRENLRRVLGWRVAEGADLRVGIAVVVLSQNVNELDAIVDLGADLGVDWIKLEGATPATRFAETSLVAKESSEIRAAVGRALERGRQRGVTMIDRTLPRPIWRCRLDDETRARLEDEESAARTVLHPCRAPWDVVCIEPNGDVRALDFGTPILGNVLETPLNALWNLEHAQKLRHEAARSRLCGLGGPVVCVDADE